MRRAIAQHPEALQWLVEYRTPEELLAKADLGGMQAPMTNGGSLFAELQTLSHDEMREWLEGAGFRKEFADMLATRSSQRSTNIFEDAIEILRDDAVKGFVKKDGKALADAFEKLPMDERMKLLRRIPDPSIEKVGARVDGQLMAVKMSDADAIRALTSKDTFQLEGLPVTSEEVGNYMRRYFDALPLAKRRTMMVAYLRVPLGSSTEVKLAAIIQKLGPGFQKLLQLLGKYAHSPTVQASIDVLLSQVEPFPSDVAVATIEQAYGKKIDQVFKTFDPKPLNAGTIGQVHRATTLEGQDVVVKVLRPNIGAQIVEEVALTKQIASDLGPTFQGVIDQIGKILLEEVDLRIERVNLDDAVRIYSRPKMGITVPKPVAGFTPSEKVLVVEMAKGKNLSKYAARTETLNKTMLLRRRKALENFSRLWFRSALFGEGRAMDDGVVKTFFHGDPHLGNLFFSPEDKKQPRFLLSVIDLGNSGHLTLEQRRGFVKLAMTSVGGTPESMMDALAQFAPPMGDTREKVLASLKSLDWQSMTVSQRLNEVLSRSAAYGIQIPPDILKFNRGKIFLEGIVDDLNHMIEGKSRVPYSYRARGLERVYFEEVVRYVAPDVFKQLTSKYARQNTVVPLGLLLQVAQDATKPPTFMRCLRLLMH